MLTDEENKSDYLEALAEELRVNGFPVEVDNNGLVMQAIFGEYRYDNKTTKQQNKMKTFAKQEVRDLLNKVIMDEISFTRMVEIMNERVSEMVSERVSERVVWRRISPEELKKGDLAIFWDEIKEYAAMRIYDRPNEKGEYFQHKDNSGSYWKNAIKFESKEQYERLINGEI